MPISNFTEKLCTFLSCSSAETQKCCELLFRVCDYNRKCLNNRTGQRSVFSWCSRACCISINSRIDLCALSPYIYPIDIRIPLSAVSQIGLGSFVRVLQRNIPSKPYPLYRDALFIEIRRGITRRNTRRVKFELDKFGTAVVAYIFPSRYSAQTFSIRRYVATRCNADRVAIQRMALP